VSTNDGGPAFFGGMSVRDVFAACAMIARSGKDLIGFPASHRHRIEATQEVYLLAQALIDYRAMLYKPTTDEGPLAPPMRDPATRDPVVLAAVMNDVAAALGALAREIRSIQPVISESLLVYASRLGGGNL